MKFHVLINPAAAGGRTLKVFRRIEPMLRKGGHEYDVLFSTRETGLDAICRQLTEYTDEDVNLLILGGDGSMHDAVCGIMDFDHTRVGFLPCGSGNDQIRDMNIGRDPVMVLSRFLEGKVRRKADIGEAVFLRTCDRIDPVSGKIDHTVSETPFSSRFNVSAGIGFDADVCRGVAVSRLKPLFSRLHIGRLIYLWTALGFIVRNARADLSVSDESGSYTVHDAMFLAAMNHQYEGGGFRFCPDADAADGKLDLCIARRMTPLRFCRIFIHAFSGRHVRYTEYIRTGRTDCIRIAAERPLWVHLDGEVMCRADLLELRIRAHQLQLLI